MMQLQCRAPLSILRSSSSSVVRISCPRRGFSSTTCRPAKRKPVRAPSLRTGVRSTQPLRKERQSLASQADSEWPVEWFESARRAGALNISAKEAVEVLDDWDQSRGSRVEPESLTMLATIMSKTHDPKHNDLINALYLQASSRKEEAATMLLLSVAFRNSNLNRRDLKYAHQHFREMIQASNPEAQLLQAQILESEHKPLAAQEMYHEATISAHQAPPGKNFDRAGAEAWLALARLSETNQEAENAATALENAAMRHDDPKAFYLLASRYRNPASPEWKSYMLKAAISGSAPAAYKLGRHYTALYTQLLAPSPSPTSNPNSQPATIPAPNPPSPTTTTTPSKPKPTPKTLAQALAPAQQWFAIASESPHHKFQHASEIFLAVLLREAGKRAAGLQMLDLASRDLRFGELVAGLRERWMGEEGVCELVGVVEGGVDGLGLGEGEGLGE